MGAAGGCQMRRTKVVLTSGKRIPTGGPGTGVGRDRVHRGVHERVQSTSSHPLGMGAQGVLVRRERDHPREQGWDGKALGTQGTPPSLFGSLCPSRCYYPPSSSVRSRTGGRLGTPSPILVKASTRISYSVYLPSPVSWALREALPSASQNWARVSKSFSLYITCNRPRVTRLDRATAPGWSRVAKFGTGGHHLLEVAQPGTRQAAG